MLFTSLRTKALLAAILVTLAHSKDASLSSRRLTPLVRNRALAFQHRLLSSPKRIQGLNRKEGRGAQRLSIRASSDQLISTILPALYVPGGLEVKAWLGFVGGAIGVVGTLAFYESARFKMKQRIQCPYCEGGVITCAVCLGGGSVIQTYETQEGGQSEPTRALCSCPTCDGIGVVACVNCKGEGVGIPTGLLRKEIKQPVDELEQALDEMGIAAYAANYQNIRARERLAREESKRSAAVTAKPEECTIMET